MLPWCCLLLQFEVYALSTADRTIPRQIHLQYCRNAEGYKPVGVHLSKSTACDTHCPSASSGSALDCCLKLWHLIGPDLHRLCCFSGPAKAAGLFYERELLTPFLHQIATRATHILG